MRIYDKENDQNASFTLISSFWGALVASSDNSLKDFDCSAISSDKIFCCSLSISIWSIVLLLAWEQVHIVLKIVHHLF